MKKKADVHSRSKQKASQVEVRFTGSRHSSTGRQELLLFYLNLARDLARDLALDIARDMARDIAFERASDLALDLTNAHDHVRQRGMEEGLALDMAMSLSSSIYLSEVVNLDLDLSADLNEVTALTRSLILYLAHREPKDKVYERLVQLDLELERIFDWNQDRSLSNGLNINRLIVKSLLILLQETVVQTYKRKALSYFTMILTDSEFTEEAFSSAYLTNVVVPYASALIEIQQVVDEIHGRPLHPAKILGIHYSSVAIDLTAGLRETVELILEYVVPWQRRTKKKLKELEVAQKEVEIEQKEVEVAQSKVVLVAEMDQVADRSRLLKAEVQKLELENHKLHLEVVQLTLTMLKDIKPDLTEEERLLYAMKMIDPVRQIAMSPLELVSVEEVGIDEEPTIKDAEQDAQSEDDETDKDEE